MVGARVVELVTHGGGGERLHIAWVEVRTFPHLAPPHVVLWQGRAFVYHAVTERGYFVFREALVSTSPSPAGGVPEPAP